MDLDNVISYLRKISYFNKLQLTSLIKLKKKIHINDLELSNRELLYFEKVFKVVEEDNEFVRRTLKNLETEEIEASLGKLEVVYGEVALIKSYICERTDNFKNINIFVTNPNLLLLFEIWKYLLQNFNVLKFYYTLLFIQNKLSVTENELSSLNDFIQSSNVKEERDIGIKATVELFLNYLHDFLLEIATEIDNVKDGRFYDEENDEDDKHNYYVQNFIRIKELYELSNFNCLLLEIRHLLQSTEMNDKIMSETTFLEDTSFQSDSSSVISTIAENMRYFENEMVEQEKQKKNYNEFMSHRRLSSSEITDASVASTLVPSTSQSLLQKEIPRLLKNFSTLNEINKKVSEVQTKFDSQKKINSMLLLNSGLASMNHFETMKNSTLEKKMVKNLNLQNSVLNNLYGLQQPTASSKQ